MNTPFKFALLTALSVLWSLVAFSQIEITEIYFDNNSGSDYQYEFIEVYNSSGSGVDVTGYTLDASAFGTINFPSITLNAGQYLIFTPVNFSDFANSAFARYQAPSFTPYRQNNIVDFQYSSADPVPDTGWYYVRNASSVIQDSVEAGAVSITSGSSLIRDPNSSAWEQSTISGGTPGGRNESVTYYGSSSSTSIIPSSGISIATSSIDLFFFSSGTSPHRITTAATCRDVIIESGVSVEIDEASTNNPITLTINETIDNDGTLEIKSECSVVQNSFSANTGSGSYLYSRAGETNSDLYAVWSSPVASADIVSSLPDDANLYDIFTFDASSQDWLYDYGSTTPQNGNGTSHTFAAGNLISGADGNYDVGRGYFIPGANSDIIFTGSDFNNGFILEPVSITGSGGTGDDDWNLVGNPYPSAIQPSLFYASNAGTISAALYFWNPNGTGENSSSSGYEVWTSSGSVSSVYGASPQTAWSTEYIVACQGFMVEATSSGNLVFLNTMRVSGNNTDFRSGEDDDRFKDGNLKTWFSLKGEQANTQILVGTSSEATDGRDGTDARKIPNRLYPKGYAPTEFYSLMNGTEGFLVQMVSDNFTTNKVIPLGCHFAKAETYTISLDTALFLGDVEVWLEDAERNTLVKMEVGSSYEFTANEGTEESRFYIHYRKNSQTGISEGAEPTADGVHVYQGQEVIWIDATATGKDIERVDIHDLTGKNVWSTSGQNKRISIPEHMLGNNSGMFLVKIVLVSGETTVHKLLLR